MITLFHEFGHGLHHMLTRVDELGVAGIAGVEWDAVELPSQFMENFCWEWDVLSRLTRARRRRRAAAARAVRQDDRGAPLPERAGDAAPGASSRCSTCACTTSPTQRARIQHVLDEVRAEVSVLDADPAQRLPHSFSHIFAGGYGAGYYSYKWAEVLSADAYSAFEEAGLFDIDTGRRYRREILEVGGSRDALDSFKAFRGREPSIDCVAAAPRNHLSRPPAWARLAG